MEKARFFNKDRQIEVIEARDLSIAEYERLYKGNLHCETDGCMAEVIFYERQKGVFKRLFKTKSRSIHINGCLNEILHKGTKGKSITVSGESINLSRKHIDDSLNDAYNAFYKKVYNIEDKPKEKGNQKNKKKTTTPKTDPDDENNINFTITSSPTTSGDGITIDGGKEPYIYKKEVSELRDKDDNSFKEVHGLVEDLSILSNEAFINISGLDGSKISIYIGTPFISAYRQEFKLLANYKTYFDRKRENGGLVILNCVGQVSKIGENKIVQVFDYRDLKLDKMGLVRVSRILNDNSSEINQHSDNSIMKKLN